MAGISGSTSRNSIFLNGFKDVTCCTFIWRYVVYYGSCGGALFEKVPGGLVIYVTFVAYNYFSSSSAKKKKVL
jgi:hypothetical protein